MNGNILTILRFYLTFYNGLKLHCRFFLSPSIQVTVQYWQDRGAVVPLRVHTIVISVQHDECVSLEEMRHSLKEQVVKAVVPSGYLDEDTIYHLQPSGRFVIGGPQVGERLFQSFILQHRSVIVRLMTSGLYIVQFNIIFMFLSFTQSDAGLTGRKIIVDTYGGWGAHGGGAFSGKDYTKVDRSAAYAARWVAKSLVKAGLCRRVLVQVRIYLAWLWGGVKQMKQHL